MQLAIVGAEKRRPLLGFLQLFMDVWLRGMLLSSVEDPGNLNGILDESRRLLGHDCIYNSSCRRVGSDAAQLVCEVAGETAERKKVFFRLEAIIPVNPEQTYFSVGGGDH